MGRTVKAGLDYFNIDTSDDLKMRILIKKFGVKGYGLYLMLLKDIYKSGYYLDFSEDEKELLMMESGLEQKEFNEICDYLFEKDFLNKELYETEHILTSHGVQKRYNFIIKILKRKIQIDKYKLLKEEELKINNNKSETFKINNNKSELSTQRKEKKKKEKKTKEIKKEFIELFEYFNETMGKNPNISKLTDNKIKLLNARFKEGYDIETMKKGIDGISQSKWHIENKQLLFKNVFSSSERLESAVNRTFESNPKQQKNKINSKIIFENADSIILQYKTFKKDIKSNIDNIVNDIIESSNTNLDNDKKEKLKQYILKKGAISNERKIQKN